MTLHEIINVLLVNFKTILKITILSGIILFLVLVIFYPVSYKATVSILPPEKSSQFSGLGSLLGSGGDFSGLLLGNPSNANSQLYIEILKSRTAADYVIKKLNLIEFYGVNDNIDAAKKLSEDLNIELTKEGIIKLDVNVSSGFIPLIFTDYQFLKEISARMSNTFVEALDKINREKLSSKAKNARIYIGHQIEVTKSVLDSVEYALMNFQNKNKAVSLPDQIKTILATASELKAEIVKTEIELKLLKQNLKEDNQSFISLQKKLSSLKDEYNRLGLGDEDYMLAFKDVPDLGRELAALLRDVKIQNEVYLLLQQQYYKELIQENKDIPTVEILDEAIPPKKATSPRILFSTILGSVFFFSITYLIFLIKQMNVFKQLVDRSNKK